VGEPNGMGWNSSRMQLEEEVGIVGWNHGRKKTGWFYGVRARTATAGVAGSANPGVGPRGSGS
jgi:hypothetical protein